MSSDDLISLPVWWVIAAWFVYLGGCIGLLFRCVGIRRFNTFSIFVPLVLVMNGIFVPFSRNINSVISGIRMDDDAFQNYWIGVALLYLFLPVGVLLANSISRKPIQMGVFFRRTRYQLGSGIYLFLIAVLCLFYLVKIYHDGLSLNLVNLLGGFSDYDEYADHRYSFAAATSSWDYFIYNKIPYAIAPMGIILAWNWRKLTWYVRWGFFLVVGLCLIQTGHKLPVVFIITLGIISAFTINQQMRISFRFYALLALLAGMVVFGIVPGFYLIQGESNYGMALWWSIERFAGESYRALQLHFYVYPQYHPHLWGTSQQTIAAIVGVQNFVPVSVYIPTEFLGLKNTSFPALFIGEAWADFGFIGVIFYATACGIVLQAYNRWYFGLRERYLEDTALFLAICVSTIHMMHSNFITAFSTYGLGTSAVIYWGIKQISRSSSSDRSRALFGQDQVDQKKPTSGVNA